jgi:protein-S-isoprenylcysteine O-methyltransferase Ste14
VINTDQYQGERMLSKQKLGAVITLVAMGAILWTQHTGPITMWQIVGALIALPSAVLWLTARFQLGSSFSVTAQARHLVTTGIYSKIRNPVYVFGLLFIAGIIIYVGRFWWLLAIPVLLALQIWRARSEAAVLEAKFGEEYRQYRARTWF